LIIGKFTGFDNFRRSTYLDIVEVYKKVNPKNEIGDLNYWRLNWKIVNKALHEINLAIDKCYDYCPNEFFSTIDIEPIEYMWELESFHAKGNWKELETHLDTVWIFKKVLLLS